MNNVHLKYKGKIAIADSTTDNSKGTIKHGVLPCGLSEIVHFIVAAVRAEVRVGVWRAHQGPLSISVAYLSTGWTQKNKNCIPV